MKSMLLYLWQLPQLDTASVADTADGVITGVMP